MSLSKLDFVWEARDSWECPGEQLNHCRFPEAISSALTDVSLKFVFSKPSGSYLCQILQKELWGHT